MSEEPSFQTLEELADYTTDDLELYYYFWVLPNSKSWYQPLEDNHKNTSRRVSQNKLISPLSIILLVTCLVVGIMGLGSWKCETKSPNYQQQTNYNVSPT
ncbi:MAG: hypothetical protein AB4062_07770 [Crocosphaera sp.]